MKNWIREQREGDKKKYGEKNKTRPSKTIKGKIKVKKSQRE